MKLFLVVTYLCRTFWWRDHQQLEILLETPYPLHLLPLRPKQNEYPVYNFKAQIYPFCKRIHLYYVIKL